MAFENSSEAVPFSESAPLDHVGNLPAIGRSTSERPKSSRSFHPLFEQPSGVMFLDIETTGLSRYYDYITLVGYEMNGEYNVLLAGDEPSHFLAALSRASSLVTFNGSGFDLPFLAASYSGLQWPKHHVDLRYACRRFGYVGGQKAIEKELGITCRSGFEGVDGAMAVILWHRYLRGDSEALRELIEYNRADVRAMAYILDHLTAKSSNGDLVSRMVQLFEFCRAPDLRRGIAQARAELPPPPSQLRQPVSFQGLFAGTVAENATVVGLDLTGSAARPSGFCVMKGSHAETEVLAEDEEIIRRVLAEMPDLVSIDSPLCLPVGRTRVTDDDPMRHLGIMRVSERILKRRGINVYPCLIPSMQRLTERGIRLAAAIRSHGVPVIECYPGAAQDIMGIPRKGAGTEWLTLGMKEFGVTGQYTVLEPTHDELDAITCSLVGFFHLAGQTEALGGDGEEPMIVPNLKPDAGMVVGISGEVAAGKTTAGKFFGRHGFAYARISQAIRTRFKGPGKKPARSWYQKMGMELHNTVGQRQLCEETLDLIPNTAADFVIDGLRWKEDVQFFRERFGGRFVHIHLTAPTALRKERFEGREKDVSFEKADADPVEREVTALAGLAQAAFNNDGAMAAFEGFLQGVLERQTSAS